ncbi:aspartyl protease family protein [Yeosuana marina]|uniref:aspartyl protease family protein n=1 Tax=Yeosuana marina TaxID=1565536 RepID=UPI0014234B9C|nr:aspartyl protease family protein [Yeosuana marina]
MKSIYKLFIALILTSCTTKKEIPVLKTTTKVISIEDGNEYLKDVWTISPEIEIDEFVPRKFNGKKNISFISDIDTLTLNIKQNETYDFVIEWDDKKAFTRVNTDILKEPSMQESEILEYYHDNKNRKALTDTIPFTLGSDNRIYLKGRINNSNTLDFLFDTGANAIVVVSNLIENKVNLKLDGEIDNNGSDGNHKVATSSKNKLEIDNLNWENVSLLSIDYQRPKFDGVLGWIAFENKIVEIDYEKKILIIHQSFETVPKDYKKIETKMIGGVPYIKGKVITENKKSEGWFEYDSGSNGSFNLSQKFASENSLNNVMKKVGTSTSTGSAGISWKSNDYILPKLQFGAFDLLFVPISISEKDPEGVEAHEILGNNLLKRFNAIIDLQKFEIYLKPNSLMNSEY